MLLLSRDSNKEFQRNITTVDKSSWRNRLFQASNFSFAVTIAVNIAADCDWRKENPGTFSQYKYRESKVCVCAMKETTRQH